MSALSYPSISTMKLYLADQTEKFGDHLDELSSKNVMKYSKSELPERVTSINIKSKRGLDDIATKIILNYRIFPPDIMTFKTQWRHEDRKMQIGDTIVQQVLFPPLPMYSLKMIFGVRVTDIIDEPLRKGFTYQTLEGHVEKGESTFTIEQLEKKLVFKIQTYSLPANRFLRILDPLLTFPYQGYCTMKALRNVRRKIEG